jgi:hypothetical protein
MQAGRVLLGAGSRGWCVVGRAAAVILQGMGSTGRQAGQWHGRQLSRHEPRILAGTPQTEGALPTSNWLEPGGQQPRLWPACCRAAGRVAVNHGSSYRHTHTGSLMSKGVVQLPLPGVGHGAVASRCPLLEQQQAGQERQAAALLRGCGQPWEHSTSSPSSAPGLVGGRAARHLRKEELVGAS